MEWTRPEIRRHFDFQGQEGRKKRYIITLHITNEDSEQKMAIIHLPFQQDGWFMKVPLELRRKVVIEGPKVEEGKESWTCHTDRPHLEGERKGLLFYSATPISRKWPAYLEPGETAMITFEALVTPREPLVEQALTLRYFPDLDWRYNEARGTHEPILRPSPFYSSNFELEKGHSA